jgi:hypothetical protein
MQIFKIFDKKIIVGHSLEHDFEVKSKKKMFLTFLGPWVYLRSKNDP